MIDNSQRSDYVRKHHVQLIRIHQIASFAGRHPKIRYVHFSGSLMPLSRTEVSGNHLANTNAVVSLCLFLIVGIYTRRVPNRRLYIMAASTVTPFIGLIALSMIPNSPANMWTKWGMYLITVPYVLALFLAWTLIPSNVAGRTKKTIISSATFLGYCVGNMAGSQIFKEADAPRYSKSISGCCGTP